MFKTREIGEQVETETLRLNSNGFSIDGGASNFIKIEGNKIFFNGEQLNATSIMTGSTDSNFLKLSESLIQAYKQGEINTLLGYLTWNISNGTNFYSICVDENNNITQDIHQILLSTNLVHVKNNINFGNKLKYESNDYGYDLYVSD